MHHYWVSALKHTKIHFRKKKKKKLLLYLWSLGSPDIFLAPDSASLIYMYICDVSIYICLNFISSGMIPNFMLLYSEDKNKHNRKSALMFLAFVLMPIFI